jgi:hypothetical protein
MLSPKPGVADIGFERYIFLRRSMASRRNAGLTRLRGRPRRPVRSKVITLGIREFAPSLHCRY